MKTRAMGAAVAVLMMAEVLVPQMAQAWWRRWGDPAAAGMYGYPRPAYPAYPGGGYAAPGAYGAPPPVYSRPGYGYEGYGEPAALPPYQQPYTYPQRGQSPQQSSDEFRACQTWATSQTGFNPSAPTASAAGAPAPSAGASLVRGGARGAALGAVGGAIGGDAGKGAAIGVAVGGLFSVMRRREEQRALEQQEQAAAQVTIQKGDAFNRALDACMSARGYTVR